MTARKKLWERVFPFITEEQTGHILQTEFNRSITPFLEGAFTQAKKSHGNQKRDSGRK